MKDKLDAEKFAQQINVVHAQRGLEKAKANLSKANERLREIIESLNSLQ